MKDYLLNFFVWYYLVKVRAYFWEEVSLNFIFLLNKTNALSMAKNLTKPLYQDESSLGRYLGFLIRFWWVGFGTLYSLLLITPKLLLGLFYIVLPILPMFALLTYLLKQI